MGVARVGRVFFLRSWRYSVRRFSFPFKVVNIVELIVAHIPSLPPFPGKRLLRS